METLIIKEEETLTIKDDVEISVFDDGLKEDTYLIRHNNRHWKVSKLVASVFNAINGKRDVNEIQEHLLSNDGINISKKRLNTIIQSLLVENGILVGYESLNDHKSNKMMWGRITLIPPKWIKTFRGLTFLYRPKVILPLSILVIFFIIFVELTNTNTTIIQSLMNLSISDILICYLVVFILGLIHEIGHSVATMYYGVEPGRIGAGVYFVMPVLFSDVTRIWKLKRRERIIVDLGGMYLQGIFLLICFVMNILLIKNPLIQIGLLLSGIQIIGNFNPFIKLDGYWVLSDYLGVSDIKMAAVNLIKSLLTKKKNKSMALSPLKKVVLSVYTISIGFFMIYFLKFLGVSLNIAIENLSLDIQYLLAGGRVTISFSSVSAYLSSRVTTFVALIFAIRLLWSLIIKNIINSIRKSFQKGGDLVEAH